MISYAEQIVFRPEDTDDHGLATRLVAMMPHKDACDRDVRCHEVARAVAGLLEGWWRIEDGKFGPVDHSWLRRVDVGGVDVILDVYAVGAVPQVQLVDMHGVLQSVRPYRRMAPREDIRIDVVNRLIFATGFRRRTRRDWRGSVCAPPVRDGAVVRSEGGGGG